MQKKNVSFTHARKNLSNILNDVYLNGQEYVVTKRDIPLAVIQKVEGKKSKKDKERKLDLSAFGIWEDDKRSTLTIEKDLKKIAWKGKNVD